MELDSRFWSFFMFLTITALFAAALCTPYHVKGVPVTFGETGLWNVDFNSTNSKGVGRGHFYTTQVLMCLATVAVAASLIGYVMLCRMITWLSQLVAFLSQMMAGLFALAAVGAFASNDQIYREGWWMAMTAGILYLLNAFVILVMPCMDSDDFKHPIRVTYIS